MDCTPKNIALLEGDVWGHRKDINDYYEIKPEIFDHMKAYLRKRVYPRLTSK
jgi:hypothetical protein